MSDDLGKKIQQIADLLGQDKVPDNVKELVAMLASSMASKNSASENSTPPTDSTEKNAAPAETTPAADDIPENPERNEPAGNTDLMDTARKALSKLNSNNDPRINLLYAIKPFMNNRRQKKIGNCIQLLQVAGLSKLLNDRDNTHRQNT